MAEIQVLPRHVSELIAAGEVVERPSSVVKEILENAIDAGADAVTLEIKRGGVAYIRITDNGCGISRENAAKAFLSHATSKLHAAEDLNAIGTLGFRGEALASICAVSRVEMLTRTHDGDMGTRYAIEGGQELSCDDAGCPVGTTLVVRDLFYNTPARMKFLKKDVAEANAVAAVIDRIALSHPEISFRFIREGKEALLTPGSGKLADAIRAVYGKEFSGGMLPVQYELGGVKVQGYVTKPVNARASRSMQNVFLNGRFVRTRTATAALEEAFKHSVMVGKYPGCVLNLSMPFDSVDINVHPAKIEVRFVNERNVFDAVYYAVRTALERHDTRPRVSLGGGQNPLATVAQPTMPKAEQVSLRRDGSTRIPLPSVQAVQPVAEAVRDPLAIEADDTDTAPQAATVAQTQQNLTKMEEAARETPAFVLKQIIEPKQTHAVAEEELSVRSAASAPSGGMEAGDSSPQAVQGERAKAEVQPPKQAAPLLVVGEVFKTYILAQSGEQLYIIDKHAAHERMLYEKLRAEHHASHEQMLLTPVTVTLNKEEYDAVLEGTQLLKESGFDVADFGSGTVLVRSCPLNLEGEDVSSLLTELAGYLQENRHELMPEKLDWLYHNVACRAAIKAGYSTPRYELINFVRRLLADDTIRYCPHGRPVLVTLTRRELEKQFGRT